MQDDNQRLKYLPFKNRGNILIFYCMGGSSRIFNFKFVTEKKTFAKFSVYADR